MSDKSVKVIDSGTIVIPSGLSLSKQDMVSHGCMNCIWKQHKMCPHGLTGKDFLDGGICQDFVNFLSGLVNDGDSMNVLWENYNLYVLRLQSLEDYKRFKDLQDEIDKIEQGEGDPGRLGDLEAKKNSYKLWWSKLNETVLKSLSKVVDREKRDSSGTTQRMTVQQMNILINDSADKLLEIEKGDKDG